MGNCFGIENEIEEPKNETKDIKFLLLGTGESGKSTLYKQIRILFNGLQKIEERAEFRDAVRRHVILCMQALIKGANKMGYKFSENSEEAKKAIEDVTIDLEFSNKFTEQVGEQVAVLWKDEAIQEAFKHRGKFQLFDNADYFFNHIERISKKDYVPTIEDIIKCRVKTTGIAEQTYIVDDKRFKFVDVGGQRNERKKWVNCFDGVTAIIYVVNIAEYDLLCYEDDKTPRVEESMQKFDEICNSPFFKDTKFLLIFNKLDLFEEKIKKVDLSTAFPDYKDGPDLEKAKQFITTKYTDLNKQMRDIEPFYVVATNTEDVKRVFEEIKKRV